MAVSIEVSARQKEKDVGDKDLEKRKNREQTK